MSGPQYNTKTGQWDLPDNRRPTSGAGVPITPVYIKPRRWPLVVGIVLALIIGFGLGVFAYRAYIVSQINAAVSDVLTPTDDRAAPSEPRTFTLEVNTEGSTTIGDVQWANGQGGVESRRERSSPWSTQVTVPADRPYDSVWLTAQLPNDAESVGTITCTVKQGGADGVVLDTETSRGQYAVASCGSNGP